MRVRLANLVAGDDSRVSRPAHFSVYPPPIRDRRSGTGSSSSSHVWTVCWGIEGRHVIMAIRMRLSKLRPLVFCRVTSVYYKYEKSSGQTFFYT